MASVPELRVPSTWQRVRSGLAFVFAACLLAPVLWLWGRSFDGLAPTAEVERERVLEQLTFLRRSMRDEDAAGRMQALFPEGACFLHTLYGLAWANVGRSGDGALLETARVELEWTARRLEDPVVLRPFGQDTQVRRGVFWLGQRNLLLAELMGLSAETRATDLEEEFHRNSAELARAFAAAGGPLEAYRGMCWPCDSIAALVSLHEHDRLYGTDHGRALDTFLGWAREHADPGTGMLPGRVTFGAGTQHEPARGCANSWNLALLARVAPAFAAAEYDRTQEHLAAERLGFRMFREWPRDDERGADVDSGPIVWGVGVTATGVGLAAARALGDVETADDIEALSGMFGFPLRSENGGGVEMRYLLGEVPVGDAFLAYARSIPLPASADRSRASFSRRLVERWPFHLLVALWCVVVVGALRFDRRRRRPPRIAADAAAEG